MKQLGDITNINGAQIEPVDCITFGSPCQDLSVAGRRAGLDGERSGLFMQAVRVIREMREATNGVHPTFAVWENVPGAFSSNRGEDFRTVLEELACIAQPDASIPRPDGRWSRAGYIRGCGWSIAWRLLDAQYWGVPQRRKRIALVVDFRGERAGEILFERESVRGDSAPRIPPWKGTAHSSQNCTAGNDFSAKICEALTATYARNDFYKGESSGMCETSGFSYGQSARARSFRYEVERSPTLRGGEGGNQWSCVCYAVDCRHGEIDAKTNGTLQTSASGGQSLNKNSVVLCRTTATGGHEDRVTDRTALAAYQAPRWRVRRLTPLECERLQGYPDGWTNIGEWTDSKGRRRKPADTPRYKALGNSIALPQWWWLTCKMAAYLPTGATLGSLFDGIGGFPLVWETRHGKGTARWASEIEEFCIAVTKARFEDE